jgi:hypothetical protein
MRKPAQRNHDGRYHLSFARPQIVAQLLRGFVDASLLADLDLDRMQRENTKFHTRSAKRREGDMIWRIPRRDGENAYLVLLLEFQSTSDRYMAVRMLSYAGLLWQHLIAEKRLVDQGKLPPLLPVVLFTGDGRWRAPLNLQDLVVLPPGSSLWPLQPRLRYHLIDISAFSTADLTTREGLPALWFRLENAADTDQLTDAFEALVAWFSDHPDYAEEAAVLGDLLAALFIRLEPDVPVPGDLMEKRMLLERAEQWKQNWRSEGRQQGRQEGRQEGEAALLLRLLQRRFGDVPQWVTARIEVADSATLEEWGLRILDAKTLSELFGEPPS